MRQPAEVERFCRHLRARNYSAHTVDNYAIDLRLFFEVADKVPKKVTWRDVDRFVERQHARGLAATTVNRRLNAVKHFFDFLAEGSTSAPVNPVKPSHHLRTGRPLPKKLSGEQVRRLFSVIGNPVDRALFLLMLRCGLRVSEAAGLRIGDVDWEQGAILVRQGKGRKDRRVYLSSDATAALRECLRLRPTKTLGGHLFWNQKRWGRALSVKAIQKKMERYALAAGVKASCHSLRHTFASNLLEEGAEVASIKEFLGHSSVTSSERYARLSNRKVKQTYLQTIKRVISKTKV
jgi:site-specific recombinase XerD